MPPCTHAQWPSHMLMKKGGSFMRLHSHYRERVMGAPVAEQLRSLSGPCVCVRVCVRKTTDSTQNALVLQKVGNKQT